MPYRDAGGANLISLLEIGGARHAHPPILSIRATIQQIPPPPPPHLPKQPPPPRSAVQHVYGWAGSFSLWHPRACRPCSRCRSASACRGEPLRRRHMACYRGERQTASRLRTAHCPSILQYSENNKLSSGAVKYPSVFWFSTIFLEAPQAKKKTVDSPKIDRWKPTLPFIQCHWKWSRPLRIFLRHGQKNYYRVQVLRLIVPRRTPKTTGTRNNNSATAYSKNYHFWQKFSDARRATPTRIGVPRSAAGAKTGDLGRFGAIFQSKSPPTKSHSTQNRLPRSRTPWHYYCEYP